MSEMVERVAKQLCDWVGNDYWSDPGAADRYREGARELIEAMRKPTEDMSYAIGDYFESGPTSGQLAWEAAIDAALR